MSESEELLALHIRAAKLPEPQREFKFMHDRKFRFDFAWPAYWLAVEVEGGIWNGGRHIRGAGFYGDCIKYNFATLLGWRILRFPPDLVKNGEALQMIERGLKCGG